METRGEFTGQNPEQDTELDPGLIELCVVSLDAANPEADPDNIAEAAPRVARMIEPLSRAIDAGEVESATIQFGIRSGGELLDVEVELHETTDEDRERDASRH